MDCQDCYDVLVENGIIDSETEPSYKLTSKGKKKIISNYNDWMIRNNGVKIKNCVKVITENNKCAYLVKNKKFEFCNDYNDEGNLIDPISRDSIEDDDVFVLNGKCFSKKELIKLPSSS